MKQNQRDLFKEAGEWLKTCTAQHITASALEKRLQIGPFVAAALADQLEDAGALSSPKPPYNQRRNFWRKRKTS